MAVKALSVRQPWAHFIGVGAKTIETRVWSTSYRGPLLICAAARWDEVAREHMDIPGLALGRATAVVELIDCRPMTKADEELAMCKLYPRAQAWVLKHVRSLAPWEDFPVKGRLGLFDVRCNL